MEKIKQALILLLFSSIIGGSGIIGIGALIENVHALKAVSKIYEFWSYAKIEISITAIIVTLLISLFKFLKDRNSTLVKSSKMNIELNVFNQLYKTELNQGASVHSLNVKYDKIYKAIFKKYGLEYEQMIKNINKKED